MKQVSTAANVVRRMKRARAAQLKNKGVKSALKPAPRLSDLKMRKRFFEGTVPQPNGCILWGRAKRGDGYGQFAMTHNKLIGAHRLALAFHTGRMPTQLVLHSCDTPMCVNYKHLREGTMADNMRDRSKRGRAAHGEGHGGAKLTAAQVFHIRSALKKGVPYKTLAATYHVSRTTISRIGNKQLWR